MVELESALIGWMRDGTIPHGPALLADKRLQVVDADIVQAVAEAMSTYDLVLLDVDNGPGYLVHPTNAEVYEPDFLTRDAERSSIPAARWRSGRRTPRPSSRRRWSRCSATAPSTGTTYCCRSGPSSTCSTSRVASVRSMARVERVVVLDDYQQIASSYVDWDRLGARGRLRRRAPRRGRAGREGSPAREVLVAMRERTAAPRRRPRPAARTPADRHHRSGNASIDVAARARARRSRCAARAAGPGPAAELTWALVLGAAPQPSRGRPRRSATGAWQDVLPGADLAGSTLGLVGLGRLGQRVAPVGLAFEMEVLAWSQNLDPDRRPGPGRRAVHQGRPARALRRGLAASPAQRPHPRHPRRRASSP